ncbi:hypothetical protein [Flavonifractor plautii]|uniref:portal protein n=1 Tax=Flavonifractor plautii TaxID=292800 RepID=UPI0012AC43B3|nr:hypothetical protein [Flavonifractor plautii]
MAKKEITPESVWNEYETACNFKAGLNLYDNVRANENFYIGKQWEGVQSNGLPTPVFNFIKRIILYVVASTATDNLKMAASPLSSSGMAALGDLERLTDVVNAQFEALFEQNKLGKQTREFMRNAAVDGDACIYVWFDPDAETGQTAKGTIRTEILENTRVSFGNPTNRDVQSQPYLLISRRELLDEVKEQARAQGGAAEDILSDCDETGDRFDAMTDGKVTTITRFWKDGGTVRAIKTTKDAVVRSQWDTGMQLYPIVWMNWDYVQNCYHGQAAVTGLIPNQIFVNKTFAMTMISLMTTAYPKIVYDKTRISRWDSGVGKAIPVNGGDVTNVARAIDPAAISPQVSQFIELAISLTKEFMGATDAALGDTRPDNTSAIIALQKASSVPMELTKQNFFQCVEDLGRIWLDQMRAYYGVRYVDLKPTEEEKQEMLYLGQVPDDKPRPTEFDFSLLNQVPLSIKLDVGGSAYWSEIAQMQTLDNLLMNGQINVVDYLERVPNGYISNQQELIQTLRERMGMVQPAMQGQTGAVQAGQGNTIDLAAGSGYGNLQRAINQTGMEGMDLSQIRV